MIELYLELDRVVEKVNDFYELLHERRLDYSEEKELKEMLEQWCEKKFMRGNEYQDLAARTINPELNNEQAMYHALHGMSGEIGEINSLYQKVYQGHEMNYEHLKKEVGDLLWFVAEFCTAMCWDLEDVMQLNIAKLRARFPDGFTAERSLHRAEGDV